MTRVVTRLRDHSARFLWSHHRLLWRVAATELRSRYAGSLLGVGWVILSPVLILGVYAAVYVWILRVQVVGLSRIEYVLYIFAGLVPFLMTAEAVSTGVASLIASKSVLSNTVFPVDLVPAKAVLSSQGTMLVGLMVILVGTALTRRLSWALVLVPLVWGLELLALVGLLWVLSLVNVVFRDLQALVNVGLMLLFVASPIAYTSDMVPAGLRPLVAINPLAYFIIAYQRMLVVGTWPGLSQGVVLVVLSMGSFAIGGWFFARAKSVLLDYV